MPITHNIRPQPISDDEFGALDYEIMELAFGVQHDFGKLCNEKPYQNELVHRCESKGIAPISTEEKIVVSHRDFVKEYYIDALVRDAAVYELKTVSALTGEHHKQVLNYLLLVGLRHGKLVNMRPPSVESRFVTTRLTPERRYLFTIQDQQWQELDEDSRWLKDTMVELLDDWGAFLSVDLFYEALVYYRGGKDKVVQLIELTHDGRQLGRQKAHLLSPLIAFKISAVTEEVSSYEGHLRRFLRLTSLRAVQWINMNHHNIEFRTLLR